MKASVCAGLHHKIYPQRLSHKGKHLIERQHKSIEDHYEPEQEEIIQTSHIKSKSIDAFSDFEQLSSKRGLKSFRKIVPVMNHTITMSETSMTASQTDMHTKGDRRLSKFSKTIAGSLSLEMKKI